MPLPAFDAGDKIEQAGNDLRRALALVRIARSACYGADEINQCEIGEVLNLIEEALQAPADLLEVDGLDIRAET